VDHLRRSDKKVHDLLPDVLGLLIVILGPSLVKAWAGRGQRGEGQDGSDESRCEMHFEDDAKTEIENRKSRKPGGICAK